MTKIVDHEDNELHLVHVLPYCICSNEYGDYAYRNTHEEGELTAATLSELAEKLRLLAVKHVLSWAVPFDKDTNTWSAESYTIPALNRFKFGYNGNGCYTDFAGKIAVAPSNGMNYVSLGAYRIEMRQEHGAAPDLPEHDYGFETVLPSMSAALDQARVLTTENLAKSKEATRIATEARKRAELAKLKAELGES